MKRRTFLMKSCACMGSLVLLETPHSFAQAGNTNETMARLTEQHLKEDFWSADAIFLSAIKYLKKPNELVRVATPFGGGMGQKDLCGYLTGGYMAIGLFAGIEKAGDNESRERCNRLAKEYYEWWIKNYPLHCKDINKSKSEPCDYQTMGKKVSCFLQEQFEKESNAKKKL